MKNIHKTLLTILCLIGYTHIPAQTAQTVQTLPETHGQVIYENLQLQKQGSTLVLSFDTHIAGKALNNRQSWTIMPQLIPSETTQGTFFPSLLINGRQKERHYNRRMSFKNKELLASQPMIHTHVPQDEEQLIRYRAEIPYESWMENTTLIFHQILTSPRNKKQLFTTSPVAVRTPEPPQPEAPPVPLIITPQPPVSRILSVSGEAYIQFPVGDINILPTFMQNNHELEKIENELRKIINNPSFTIVNIQLTGYASPEGSFALNKRLSEGRTKSLKDHLADKYNISPGIIRLSHVAEDWTRLRELVEKSQIKEKESLLQIIDSGDNEDTKEKKLRALPVWNTLVKDYFPQLRRVDYQILYKQEITN